MQEQGKGHQLTTGGRAINVVRDPVGVRVLPCQKACARRRAERCGDKGITKQCTFPADAINVGCLDERMAHNAQFVPAQIVYQDEDDVRARAAHRTRRAVADPPQCEGQ